MSDIIWQGSAVSQQAQIDDMRAKGVPVSQAMLDNLERQKRLEDENARIKAENAKAIADAAAAKDAAYRAGVEAAMKARALAAFTESGGTPADFEQAWPELRKKVIEQSTLDRLANEQTAQSELIRRKVAEGYRNAF